MSERFTAEGDGKNESDTSSCSVSLDLKEFFGCGGYRDLFLRAKRAPGHAYNESDEKNSLFLSIYLVYLCGGVCMCVCVFASGCLCLQLCRMS